MRIGATKKKGSSVDKKEEGKKWGEMNRRERERKTEKKRFCFSLRSTETGPSVFVRARGKVGSTQRRLRVGTKSGSFVKLQEVGNFPTRVISSLKAI